MKESLNLQVLVLPSQPLGGGAPVDLRGQHVVQRVLGVRQELVQIFYSNTSVYGACVAVSAPTIFAAVLATLSSRSVSAFLELSLIHI